MEFKTIALPTTRIQLAKLIADKFENFGLHGADTKIKSRGNHHQITLRFDGKCSDFQIKVANNFILITKSKTLWEMFTIDRENNTATTIGDVMKPSLICEMLVCALSDTESRVHKIYDLAEALAELYAGDLDWMINYRGNLTCKMTINEIELTLNFDQLNGFDWSMIDYYDEQEIEPESVDSTDEFHDHWFGDSFWLCDGTYNYMATGFNACKTWQKLTQDLEFAFAHIMSTRN
ncbi:hypothetical protein [Aeromonas hydrophila]|uniref:hypothetical protein n=1 Tax=Aeromonas hydrophila TaxID=644 RepID=UPI003EC4BBB6